MEYLHILFLLPLLALVSARPTEEDAEQKKPKEENDSERAPSGPSTPRIHPFPPPRFGQGIAPSASFEAGAQGAQPRSPFQSPPFSSYPYGGVGAAGASQFQPQFSQYGANSQLGGSYAAQQPFGYGGASGGASGGFGAGAFGGGGSPPAYNALGGGSYGQPGGGFGGGGFGGQRSGLGGFGGGGAPGGGAGGGFPQQSFAGLPSNYNPQTVGYYGNGRIPSSYQGFGGGPNGNLAQRAGNGFGFVY